MYNARVGQERGVPLWAFVVPAIGVPLMVALLSLTAPKLEESVGGADLGATPEQLEWQAADRASGLTSDCTGRQSNS
jgi:hypothetical protein